MLEKLKKVSKKEIIKEIASIVMLILVSLLIERFGFGHKLNSLAEADKGVSVIKNSDIIADNFTLNEKGEFVSQAENASLVVPTENKYINNLELDLSENPNYSFTVKYTDPKTNQEVVLQNKLGKSLQKKKLNFLKFAIFNIQNNSEKITIQAQNAGITITKIKVDNSYHFNFYRFIFIFAIGLLLLIFFALRKKIGQKPELVFFAIALICGTLISISEPKSFVSWDERIHFVKADKLSYPNIIKKKCKRYLFQYQFSSIFLFHQRAGQAQRVF